MYPDNSCWIKYHLGYLYVQIGGDCWVTEFPKSSNKDLNVKSPKCKQVTEWTVTQWVTFRELRPSLWRKVLHLVRRNSVKCDLSQEEGDGFSEDDNNSLNPMTPQQLHGTEDRWLEDWSFGGTGRESLSCFIKVLYHFNVRLSPNG